MPKSPTHRTPWEKMKNIIHSRSSSKKRRRFSSRSDDLKIEESAYSDNEDVFLPTVSSNDAKPLKDLDNYGKGIPPEILERYRRLSAAEIAVSIYKLNYHNNIMLL